MLKQPAAFGRKLMIAHVKGLRDYLKFVDQGRKDAEIQNTIKKWTKIATKDIQGSSPMWVDRNSLPNTANLLAQQDLWAAAGQVDLIPGWVTSGGVSFDVEAQKQGKKVERILIADHGMDIYGEALLASEKTMREKPELVRRFLKATYQGIAEAVKDPNSALDALYKAKPELKRESTQPELQATIRHTGVQVAQTKGWGYMDEAKIQRTLDTIVKGAGISAPVKAQDISTNEFIPKN